MKKIITLSLLSFFLTVHAEPTLQAPNNPAAKSPYAPFAPEWKVSSVYAPRSVTSGSKFHEGIDYNQQQGDLDKGVILKSLDKGTIELVKAGTFRIDSGSYRMDYIHIFDKPTVDNANVKIAGYDKLVLKPTTVKKDSGKGTCGAVYFYGKTSKKLTKILTSKECSNFVGSGIKAKTQVSAKEDISPMDRQGTGNVHLHLQMNNGDDNALLKVTHSKEIIAGKTQFEAKLVKDTFNDDSIKAMTAGQGLALQITENSYIPTLNRVKISSDDPNFKDVFFDFGGEVGKSAENVTQTNVIPNLDLTKGSSELAIKPAGWDESGTPKILTFFIPYDLSKLKSGKDYLLHVEITSIDGDFVNPILNYKKEGGGGYTKIANNGSILPDSAVLGKNPTDWACTKDNKTGLIWEVKTSDGGLRDKNNKYTNYDAIYPKCDWNNCEKDFPSKLGASTNTDGFVKAVNAQGLCGSSNWRLPTKDELLTISPAGYGTGYFEDNLNHYYWSSSPSANYSSDAWLVTFYGGNSNYGTKFNNVFVRLVR
jgi:hypothetical protein